MICDLAMPRMNGLQLVEHLRNAGDALPILIISATENMADIAKALRLGVQDVLLKPVKDLNRLRETVLACLYPNMFNSRVEEEERLFEDWDALVSNPAAPRSRICCSATEAVAAAGSAKNIALPDKLSSADGGRCAWSGFGYCAAF